MIARAGNRIGIVDAELLGNGHHRFPNLACMKLSAHHKKRGDKVSLVLDYNHVRRRKYDRVYLSCVFTKIAQDVPEDVLELPHVQHGGTGFHFDKYQDAPKLPRTVEHTRPDYSLYDEWLKLQAAADSSVKYYTDYSIGFLTRGCSRGCKFCVNRYAGGSACHSPLDEFFDPDKKLCLLDDNLFASKDADTILEGLVEKEAQFEFKQGLDIRLMTAKRARLLKQARYCGEFIFAFDQLKDRKQVEKGLATFRKHLPTTGVKCYVFCGFEDLTEDDIASVFERVKVLWKHGCLAYVMRHENHRHAHRIYRGLYVQLARWCNQPEFQRTLSFREFCERSGGKAERDALAFQQRHSQIAKKYFGMRYSAV